MAPGEASLTLGARSSDESVRDGSQDLYLSTFRYRVDHLLIITSGVVGG